MPRLGEEAIQDKIADSLLGEQPQEIAESPEEQGYFGDSDPVALLDSAIADQKTDRMRFGDSMTEAERQEELEPELRTERTESQPEPESEQREAPEDWETRLLSPEE